MKVKLNPSGVEFNEAEHTYTLDGRQLHGITGMISRQLFPDKYDDIPQATLDKAAAYGTAVHSTIELCDTFEDYDNKDPNYRAYRELMERHHLKTVANEYIVTDGEYFATPIDILAIDTDTEDLVIIDIKTTSKHDGEYVSWQGSIAKHLFYLTNPHLIGRVSAIYTLWLPKPQYGTPRMFLEVERDEEDVKALLDAERNGRQYMVPVVKSEGGMTLTADAIAEVYNVEQMLAEIKDRSKELRDGLLLAMKEHSVKSFKCDKFMLTRVVPSGEPQYTLDTERLKAEHPEIYEEYKKEKKQSESLRLKLY